MTDNSTIILRGIIKQKKGRKRHEKLGYNTLLLPITKPESEKRNSIMKTYYYLDKK